MTEPKETRETRERVAFRCAITGKFITANEACHRPDTTVRETFRVRRPRPPSGDPCGSGVDG